MSSISATAIFRRIFVLVRESWGLLAAAILVLTAVGIAADISGSAGLAGLAIVSTGIGVMAQLVVTRNLVTRTGLVTEGRPRKGLWTVLGVSLLYGFGVALGTCLLVLPGVYVFVRWFAAIPAALAEALDPAEALTRSWNMTKGSEGAVLLVGVAVYAPMLFALFLLGFFSPQVEASVPQVGTSAVSNLVVYGPTVIGWYAAVAVYDLLQPSGRRLETVFA
jgi:hypothetical protein